ncbi:MAG: ATP-binding protein [Caldilineaceae bacterium]
MFVNRVRELKFLQEHFASDSAELLVIYGRRRVGKTELLRTFCQDKPTIFYVADLGTEENALAEFTRQISGHVYANEAILSPFATWDGALRFLAQQAQNERIIVVFDEFTYQIGINDAVPSIIQKVWDETLGHSRIMLVLCGSYVGMMEQEVLAYRSPLYGRRTGQWQLQPFTFWEARQLLPAFSAEEMVRAYAVLGGVPAYLRQFDDRVPVMANIERHILATGAFLYDEPRFLLLQELRDPSRYFSILEAIAGGRTRLNEIAQASGIAATSVNFYLKTLQEMALVARIVPATEKNPAKSKLGLYQLIEHYFRFWFRFVYPYRSLLERGETAQVLPRVTVQLDQFIGSAFEAICREAIWRIAGSGDLSFLPHTVGNWWDRQNEIDVVALGEESVLFGECKWSINPVGVDVLDALKQKAQPLIQKYQWPQVNYVLFARTGFTPALQERAAQEDIILVDMDRLWQL